jgi:hypothetical protein
MLRLLQVIHSRRQPLPEASLHYRCAHSYSHIDALLAGRAGLLVVSLLERVAGGVVSSPVLLPAELLPELEALGYRGIPASDGVAGCLLCAGLPGSSSSELLLKRAGGLGMPDASHGFTDIAAPQLLFLCGAVSPASPTSSRAGSSYDNRTKVMLSSVMLDFKLAKIGVARTALKASSPGVICERLIQLAPYRVTY